MGRSSLLLDMTSVVQHPVLGLVGNVASLAAIGGALAGLLPPIAALAAIVWYAISIWESESVQSWHKGREFVRLRKRQIATAKILKAAQEADAKALLAFQQADAKALHISQVAAPLSSSPAAGPPG